MKEYQGVRSLKGTKETDYKEMASTVIFVKRNQVVLSAITKVNL